MDWAVASLKGSWCDSCSFFEFSTHHQNIFLYFRFCFINIALPQGFFCTHEKELVVRNWFYNNWNFKNLVELYKVILNSISCKVFEMFCQEPSRASLSFIIDSAGSLTWEREPHHRKSSLRSVRSRWNTALISG